MKAYMDTGLKNSLPYTTDWLSKWEGAKKKHTRMEDKRKKTPRSKKTPKKEAASITDP